MTFAYQLPDVVPVDCHGCRPFCNEVCEACPGPKAKPKDTPADASECLEEERDDG